MRIAILGASGRTGRHVITQARERGHEVRAIARHVDTIPPQPDLAAVAADALDPAALTEALAGCTAVICALGVGTSRAPTELYSRGIANTLAALRDVPGARLTIVSAAPAGPRDEQHRLERWVLMPILDRLFGATYEDMRRMESLLDDSPADWIVLRPPRLVSKPATGTYRLGATPLPKGRAITYPDLARALVDLTERPDRTRQALYIAN